MPLPLPSPPGSLQEDGIASVLLKGELPQKRYWSLDQAGTQCQPCVCLPRPCASSLGKVLMMTI